MRMMVWVFLLCVISNGRRVVCLFCLIERLGGMWCMLCIVEDVVWSLGMILSLCVLWRCGCLLVVRDL